jgi:hypothetical protein
MKKMINRSMFLLVGLAFVFASCGKYEGGPGLSLLTKKGRLAGTWDISSFESANGDIITFEPNTLTMTFEKDGSYMESGTIVGFTFSDSGSWEFNSEKTAIVSTIDGESPETTEPIYRLTSEELWFKDADGDITKYTKK